VRQRERATHSESNPSSRAIDLIGSSVFLSAVLFFVYPVRLRIHTHTHAHTHAHTHTHTRTCTTPHAHTPHVNMHGKHVHAHACMHAHTHKVSTHDQGYEERER
jgi:Ca2+/H+ antiporter